MFFVHEFMMKMPLVKCLLYGWLHTPSDTIVITIPPFRLPMTVILGLLGL